MNDRPDGAALRRDVAAAALVVAGLLGLLSNVLLPDLSGDHAARLSALHDAGATAVVSAVAFLLMQLPLMVSLLGLGHLLRPHAPRTSTAAVLVGGLGAFGHTVLGGLSMVYVLMARSGSPATRSTYVGLYAKIESSPVMLFSVIGLAGTVIGMVLLIVALFRSHAVAVWVPGLLVAFVVLEFAGSAISPRTSDLSALCLLVAFATLARQVHRMPVSAWQSPSRAPERVPQPV
jgi:hypothetical protein